MQTKQYETIELPADDVCMCGHRRDHHDYSETETYFQVNTCCSDCNCSSWNISDNSEFVLPWKRIWWRITNGYKTPMVVSKTWKVLPFTEEEISSIRKEFNVQ